MKHNRQEPINHTDPAFQLPEELKTLGFSNKNISSMSNNGQVFFKLVIGQLLRKTEKLQNFRIRTGFDAGNLSSILSAKMLNISNIIDQISSDESIATINKFLDLEFRNRRGKYVQFTPDNLSTIFHRGVERMQENIQFLIDNKDKLAEIVALKDRTNQISSGLNSKGGVNFKNEFARLYTKITGKAFMAASPTNSTDCGMAAPANRTTRTLQGTGFSSAAAVRAALAKCTPQPARAPNR